MVVKSEHLVRNPGPGPAPKCAPGHDSSKDSNISKTHWLKSGVADSQIFKLRLGDIWEGVPFYAHATSVGQAPE